MDLHSDAMDSYVTSPFAFICKRVLKFIWHPEGTAIKKYGQESKPVQYRREYDPHI